MMAGVITLAIVSVAALTLSGIRYHNLGRWQVNLVQWQDWLAKREKEVVRREALLDVDAVAMMYDLAKLVDDIEDGDAWRHR